MFFVDFAALAVPASSLQVVLEEHPVGEKGTFALFVGSTALAALASDSLTVLRRSIFDCSESG